MEKDWQGYNKDYFKSRVRFKIGDEVQFIINSTMYSETGEKDLGILNCKGAKTTIKTISIKHPDLVKLHGYENWYMENDLKLVPVVTLQNKKSILDLMYPDVVQVKNQKEHLILKSVYRYLSEYKSDCDCYLIPNAERSGLGIFNAYQEDLYTIYKFNDLDVDLLKPVMPEKWCVKVNERIQPLVNNFLRTNKSHWPQYSVDWKVNINNWFYYPRIGEFCWSDIKIDIHTEITPELFEIYITTERKKLLDEAKKRYPEGTQFKSAADSSQVYISGGNSKEWINSYYPDGIGNDGNDDAGGLFYVNGNWAEIVNKSSKYDTIKYIKITKSRGNNTTHPEFKISYAQAEVGLILKVIRFDKKATHPCFICEGGYVIYPNYCEEVDVTKSTIENVKDYKITNSEVYFNECKPNLYVGELNKYIQLISSGANLSRHPKCNTFVTPDDIGKIYQVFQEEVYHNIPCYICADGHVFYKDCCQVINLEETKLWKKESFNQMITELEKTHRKLPSFINSKYFPKVEEFKKIPFTLQRPYNKKQYFIKSIEI